MPQYRLIREIRVNVQDDFRTILSRIIPAHLAQADDKADLFEHGLTSFMATQVLMGLEEAYDITFPDELMRRDTFSTIDRMRRVVAELKG